MKKVLGFTLMILLFMGHTAEAHTGLKNSSPEKGSTVTEATKTITLTFETEIEETSSFELQKRDSERVPVQELSVSGNTITGIMAKPLENGEYQVDWEIIGADGHPIGGVFSFKVRQQTTPPNQEDKDKEEVPNKEGKKVPGMEMSIEKDSKSNEKPTKTEPALNSTIAGTFVGMFVILAGSVWWMRRRT